MINFFILYIYFYFRVAVNMNIIGVKKVIIYKYAKRIALTNFFLKRLFIYASPSKT